ncbi:IS3 family transposase, partial [Burkholderia lata]|uniref:IS3 family transposase n=1 Tax=Burkholderia lata (strain ATCC 17760 / DSM 23089 / LMG 22485 / NCIMB 9086 / R18194 / 383) TaxID=482957 RepID=UPI0020C711E5
RQRKHSMNCYPQHNDRCCDDSLNLSKYASWAYRDLAAEFGMTVSMSRRANAWDNAPMESFFKTLKVERIYQTRYETRAQARLDIVDWIEGYYNRQRMHTSIDYCTPVEYETLRAAA